MSLSFKILNIIESFSLEAKAVLDTLGQVDYVGSVSQEEFAQRALGYDVLVVRLGVNVTREIIENAKNLKAIATATTGLDHINLGVAEERGVKIVSLRDETEFLNTITGTAELAFGMLIDLARLTPWAFDAVRKYEWEMERYKGHNLAGMTLGVLGLGRLGHMVARFGHAFGMKVIFCDPNVQGDESEEYKNYMKVDFETLVRESDALSINVHLKEDTDNLFTADILKKMKKNCYLINTSRGRIVNQGALIQALEQGIITGYATDVLEGETEFIEHFADHPLVEYARKNQNCIIVPHTGGLTFESRRDTDVFIVKKLLSVLNK